MGKGRRCLRQTAFMQKSEVVCVMHILERESLDIFFFLKRNTVQLYKLTRVSVIMCCRLFYFLLSVFPLNYVLVAHLENS